MKRRTAKGLREIKIVPGKSMDEIDNASFGAGPPPMASRPTTVNLRAGEAEHPPGAPVLCLDGAWEMACEGAEQDRLSGVWADGIPVRVPGSVHTALVEAGRLPDPVVGRNQLLAAEHSYKTWWLRRTFVGPADTDGAQLVFDGVANRCTVWLNGRKLGGHEGMFGGPEYDVSKLLRDENTLVVKLDAVELPEGVRIGDSNQSWRTTVVFNNSYGWHYSHCPPLGIWRSVRIEGAPAVRVDHPFVATRDAGKKEVDLAVTLSGRSRTWSGKLVGTIRPENYDGPSRTFSLKVRSQKPTRDIHLRFRMPKAQLWWPRGIGEPNLHRMRLSFVPSRGGLPVTKEITFGIRTVEMAPLPGRVDSGVDRTPRPGVPRPDKFNWTFVINGRPMFVKGTGWCTPDALMDFSRERYDRFLTLAADQHCQMVRAWGSGMPEIDDFYDLCDRKGLMVLQEWPTAWNSHETQPYDVLEETVRRNTLRLRSHPSLVMWGGGNESPHPFGRAIDMMGRLSIELDGTRPFHRGEQWGGSMHGYPCYWGRESLDATLKWDEDFYGEFGTACMPVFESVRRYMPDDEMGLWPPPPDGSFAYHVPVFNREDGVSRLTQNARYFARKDCGIERFTVASQVHQVVALRHTLERARTRWPACTGALYYKMNDNFPAASWATADWYGAPKMGHYFCQDAFAPLHACVIFSSMYMMGTPLDQPVFLLDDADALKGAEWQVRVRAYDGQLGRIAEEVFAGSGSIKSPQEVGHFRLAFEQTETAPLFVVSEVLLNGRPADRTFYWLNYEFDKGCLFRLPQTRLNMRVNGNEVVVKNEGELPAAAVNVARPGHLDSFRASDNFFWLDAGEEHAIAVNEPDGLTVEAWNAPAGENPGTKG